MGKFEVGLTGDTPRVAQSSPVSHGLFDPGKIMSSRTDHTLITRHLTSIQKCNADINIDKYIIDKDVVVCPLAVI